jgi:heterodisulfide reductase subunit C
MKKTGGTVDLVSSPDASEEEVFAAIAGMKDAKGGLQPSPTWKCGKCLAYCPAGHWKEKFKDTKLSQRLPLTNW